MLVGLEMLLLTIVAVGFVSALIPLAASAGGAAEVALGVWGIAYSTYLWVSFFLIGSLRIPGCEFVAINHVIRQRKVHWCVDSVLNAVLDKMQDEKGLGIGLLKTESAQKWTIGLAALTIFLGFLASGVVGPGVGAAAVGVFTTCYLAYDVTIHRVSIGRPWLTGSGDYPKLLLILLRARRGRGSEAPNAYMTKSVPMDQMRSSPGLLSVFTNPGKRLKALRFLLIGWGVASIPIDIYTGLGLALPSDLPVLQYQVSFIYENMLSAIYIPLAICAVLAAADPAKHKLLVLFIITSSFVHASVMTYHAFMTTVEIWSGLTIGSAFLFATGIAFAVFYPRGVSYRSAKGPVT